MPTPAVHTLAQSTPTTTASTPAAAAPTAAAQPGGRPPYLVRVDQATKSATIHDATGRVVAAYAPGITRRTLPGRVAVDGWALPGRPVSADWDLSSPPDGHEHPIRHLSEEPHLVNAVLDLLLRYATDDTDIHIRDAARAAGLLWYCEDCRTDQPGGQSCAHCHTPPPADTPEQPEPSATHLVSAFTGTSVATYDDPATAQDAATAANARHGHDALAVGTSLPHSPPCDPDVLDTLAATACGQ